MAGDKSKVIIINAADWQQLLADTQGTYFDPNPSQTLWGIPVVVSPNVPRATGLLMEPPTEDMLRVRCACCGIVADPNAGNCFGGRSDLPPCLCYFHCVGQEKPEICPDCKKCRHHHPWIPFGVCVKPQFVQDVVRERAREHARRRLAEEGGL